jgi:hypothetical protein
LKLRLKQNVARTTKDEDGGATVEFVLLFPTLLFLLGILMDVSYMYYKKSQILVTVQDFTRHRSIGTHTTNAETENLITAALATQFSDEAVVSTTLNGGIVSTQVTVPLHDMQILGFFGQLAGDFDVHVGAQQYIEWWDVEAPDNNGTTVGLGEDPDSPYY